MVHWTKSKQHTCFWSPHGYKRRSTDIDRFRNYPGFRNYDSETKIQKLFRPIQKLRFRNYSRRIQKLFSTDSETTFDRFRNYFRPIQKLFCTDSETIFDRFRNQVRPIQKLRFRNYFRPIQKLFSTDSETIFDFRPIQKLGFRYYLRRIQKLFSTEWDTTIGIPCCQAFCFYLFFVPPPLLLGNLCFQWFPPPPLPSWQPMLSMMFFLSIFPPPFLATHAFNDILFIKKFPPPSWQPMHSMIFFLSKISPPLFWQPMLSMISLSTPLPSWQPMLSMFLFCSIFPIPPSWQPMLSMIFPPPPCLLGNPCFQWCFFYQFFPPPSWQPMLSMISLSTPLPSWQPMLSMILFCSIFPIPPSWQPMLSMIFPPPPHAFNDVFSINFSPPFLATHAFNAFNDCLFIKYFPPRFVLASHALNDLPPSPCLRLVFIAYVLNDSLFIDFSFPPSWQPLLSMIFFLSKFPPPLSWQPMLSMPSMIFFLSNIFPPHFVLATHALNDLPPSPCPRLVFKTHVLNDSLFMNFPSSPLLGNLCFQWLSFFYQHFPPFLASHAFNDVVFI